MRKQTVVCIDCKQATTLSDLKYPCCYCGGKVISQEKWTRYIIMKERRELLINKVNQLNQKLKILLNL